MMEKDKQGENFTEEFLHPRKDGSRFWARLDIQFVKTSEGGIAQRFGVLDNISREKEAEHLLRISEEKYRNIIANMNLGLVEVDHDDHIQYVNHSFCEMSGYDESELIGKEAGRLFIRGENADLIREKNTRRKQGKSDAYELPIRNKRGELRYWLISGAPRMNDEGEVIGSIGIHLDITQQKLQENELREARVKAEESSVAKETFLANMSHEIRTPLNAVIGMLRELGRNDLSLQQRSYIDKANTASKHLLSVINNILDMSKIGAGEFQLEKRHFDLRKVISETVSIVTPQATDKLLKIKVNLSEKIKPAIIGDPGRIRQMLLNVLGNSIKFTEKGFITVSCDVVREDSFSQRISIEIADTGIGMEKDFLQNIFSKFSQEDKSTARRYGGTGLGMAITRELTELMGGTVIAKSEKGKGSSILFSIPFPNGDEKQIEEVLEQYNYNDLNGLRVLLVEDNEMNRLVAKNTLSYFGAITTEAENGKLGIECLRNHEFDIVLMDMQMPEMDGLEATRVIRNELKSKVPVIALTANAFKNELDNCMSAGMNDYVTKPFEESMLLQAVIRNTHHKRNLNATPGPLREKLYDLTKLIETARGNKEFINKMIKLFVEQAPSAIEKIRDAFSQADYKTVKETAHRIKPSIDNMGINVLKQPIRDVEALAAEDPGNELLKKAIEQCDQVISEVVKELAHEIS
jgi:PAS domain S-box-containing protein